MSDSSHFIGLAEKCRRLARAVDDPLTSDRLLKLADEYMAQADIEVVRAETTIIPPFRIRT
jgi:hypothetical protein